MTHAGVWRGYSARHPRRSGGSARAERLLMIASAGPEHATVTCGISDYGMGVLGLVLACRHRALSTAGNHAGDRRRPE